MGKARKVKTLTETARTQQKTIFGCAKTLKIIHCPVLKGNASEN
jgi:hypothetical protein